MIKSIILNRKNTSLVFSILTIALTLFLFGPIIMYAGNANQFGVSLFSALLILLIPLIASSIILYIIGSTLSEKRHKRYVSLLNAIGLLLWIQGTFVIWDLGVLDGSSINWDTNIWRGIVDLGIWISILTLAIFKFYRFYKLAKYIFLIVCLSQLTLVIYSSIQDSKIWTIKSKPLLPPTTEIFEFSEKQNVLHILLDQFGSPLFEQILNKHNSLNEELKGFTFFKEITTSSPVTYLSVPSYLSGQIYTNDISVHEFYQRFYKKDNIHTLLHGRGYELDIVNQPRFLEKREIDKNYYNVPTPYSQVSKSWANFKHSAFLFDLVLFRHIPFYLKRNVYNDQSWLISNLFVEENELNFEHFSANQFLDNFAHELSIKRELPVYKYIHLMTPHPPLVVDNNFQPSKNTLPATPQNFKYQATYTTNTIINLLRQLKKLENYNSMLIIIQSDHGSGIPFKLKTSDGKLVSNQQTMIPSDAFLPLLLIKPPFSDAPFSTSKTYGDLSDLPATISSLLNLPNDFRGQSLYSESYPTNKARKVYYSFKTHRNDAMVTGFFEELDEFLIKGSAYELSSWSKSQVLKRNRPVYIWGTSLDFSSSGNVLPYLQKGWSMPEEHHIWNDGMIASITLPISISKKDSIELSCQIIPFIQPNKQLTHQNLQIKINNIDAGQFKISKKGSQSIRLRFPVRLISNSSNISLEFHFPDATKGTDVGLINEGRILGFAFQSISLHEL